MAVYIKYFGAGTQKLEDELARRFEGVKRCGWTLIRRRQSAHEKLLERFEKEKADVSSGHRWCQRLDFHAVTLVGVVAADTSLYIDDYKSAERTFSLITQVCGRGGAQVRGARLYRHTRREHSAIIHAQKHDYVGFIKMKLSCAMQCGIRRFARLCRFWSRVRTRR